MAFEGRPVMSSPSRMMRPEARAQHAGQAVEEGRFAGAVRPDDRVHGAARDFEIDAGQRRQPAETDGQQFGLEDRRRRRSPAVHRGASDGRHLCAHATSFSDGYADWNLQAGGTKVFSLGTIFLQVIGAAADGEDEFAQEGLMVVLAQRLVALREVVALLHLEALRAPRSASSNCRGCRTSTSPWRSSWR